MEIKEIKIGQNVRVKSDGRVIKVKDICLQSESVSGEPCAWFFVNELEKA